MFVVEAIVAHMEPTVFAAREWSRALLQDTDRVKWVALGEVGAHSVVGAGAVWAARNRAGALALGLGKVDSVAGWRQGLCWGW